jgi:hypothetical protein
MDGIDELGQFSRENLRRIWKTTREGRALVGEEHRLAEAMRAHPEFHDAWEAVDLAGSTRTEVEGKNPHLHITVHAIVEGQLEADDPPEVTQALQRLRRRGFKRHDAIHLIGAAWIRGIHPVLTEGKAFELDGYRKRLRRLGR